MGLRPTDQAAPTRVREGSSIFDVALEDLRTAAGGESAPMRFEVLDYVVLIVTDLERSLAFYKGPLGLALRHRAEQFAQLETGTTRLALYSRDAMARTLGSALEAPALAAPSFELGFKVDDCDAAFADLVAAGAVPAAEPRTRPWGQRTAYVRDPDGYLIELAQDLGR